MKKLISSFFGLLLVSSLGASAVFGITPYKPQWYYTNTAGSSSEVPGEDIVFLVPDESGEVQKTTLDSEPYYVDVNQNGVIDAGDTFTFKVSDGSGQ